MQETAVVLRPAEGQPIVEPLGWRIDGVISPLGRGFWEHSCGLLCSPQGIIVVGRTFRGDLRQALIQGMYNWSPDDLKTFAFAMRPIGVAYPNDEITAITVRERQFKHAIRLRLWDGQEIEFYVYARRAIDAYRALLRRTYRSIYHEKGFGGGPGSGSG